MTPKLIIFSAPSGSGKTSIVKEILKTDIPFGFSISATSRPPRDSEKHAKDYYFLSVDEFKKGIANNDFLEWEEVYHNQFYGTLKAEVDRLRENGKNVIFDVDVIGGLNVKNYYGDEALSIFIEAPSLEELEKRLSGRGTEDEESLKMRLDKAKQELTFASQFDLVVINDKLDIAVQQCFTKIKEFVS